MGVELAEAVLNAFLAVLKWFYCESDLNENRLPSLYDVSSGQRPDGRPQRVGTPDSVGVTLHIDRDFKEYSGDERQHLLTAIESLLQLGRPLTVVRMTAGSVFLTLRLSPEKAKDLLKGIADGLLRKYRVIDGWATELSMDDRPVR